METLTKPTDTRLRRFTETGTVYPILFMISITHLLNDMMQSVIPAVYPLLKEKFGFTFAQIGIITLVFQMTSSLLQPFIGLYADRHPRPYSLAAGMCFTLLGLFTLSVAPGFVPILLAVGLIGCGSSVFHPESSRVEQLGNWYKLRLTVTANHPAAAAAAPAHHLGKRKIRLALGILGVLVFSKYFYIASMTNYFTFFLMDKFGISVQGSQYCLFAFLGASAVGTVAGGPLGDRFGRKYVIWGSILGAAPFTLLLPYANLTCTIALAVIIGLVISSAFSAILVYATDLMPGKVGMVAGIFFGLMFGLGGLGSAFFGWLADKTSIEFIFRISTLLPLLGIITGFLPNIEGRTTNT